MRPFLFGTLDLLKMEICTLEQILKGNCKRG